MSGTTFPACLTNISGGGAHVVVATFVPRTTLVELEIPPGNELPAGRARARVMKVQMVDREPRYGVGLRFEDDESEVVRALQAAEVEEADA